MSSTHCAERAAADLNIAPIFVGWTISSSTTMFLNYDRRASGSGRGGRRNAARTPLVRLKPVILFITSRGALNVSGSPARFKRFCISSFSIFLSFTKNERGFEPDSRARPMTIGVSAINTPGAGSLL